MTADRDIQRTRPHGRQYHGRPVQVPCPVKRHAHDCDCHRKSDGSWSVDATCAAWQEGVRAAHA